MNEKKALKRSAGMSMLWILIAMIAVAGVTYAWFAFSASTNIEPNTGSTISSGDASLLISSTKDGKFDKKCDLLPQNADGDLFPVSTASLDKFYKSKAQDANGISIMYRDATSEIDDSTLYGYIYLKSDMGSMDVYFFGPNLNFGSDVQTLAAMRLGVKMTSAQTDVTHIFNLDSLADTSSAKAVKTVPVSGTVVKSIKSNGEAEYTADPSADITDYYASVTGADDKDPKAGKNKLCTIGDGEIIKVEYWLYLEGCDDNCSNPVQSRDVELQLAFAGVQAN